MMFLSLEQNGYNIMPISAKGLFINLRKPEEVDIPIIATWLKDQAFLSNLYGTPLQSEKAAAAETFSMLQQNAEDMTKTLTLLAAKTDGEPVGFTSFNNINWKDGLAEFNIVIGNKSNRNFFYGPELGFLSLLYAFHELNLHKVFAYVYDHNQPAMKLTKFVGVDEGILRKHIYRDGHYVDLTISAVFAEDFERFIAEQRIGILRKYFQRGLLS